VTGTCTGTGAAEPDLQLERRERFRRHAAAGALCGSVPLCLVLPGALTGDAGATVGAVVAAVVLLALAVAVWPVPWSAAEREHRRLDARWRSARTDGDVEVPWPRCLAWAEADGTTVVLSLIMRVPARPSGFREHVKRRLDPDDVAAAAEAMEELRETAQARECAARTAWHEGAAEAERRREDEALGAVDAAGRQELAHQEARMRAELAAQERLEQQAQARAVAEALRRR
jgi:hypothetical protein